MKRAPKIGLLPLYLELYDDAFPYLRGEFEPLLQTIENGFQEEGVRTHQADICRIASEFENAVQRFIEEDVDLIVAVHLAYSLSLESIDVFQYVSVPILLLDTTMDFEFDRSVDPARIMLNHGIHGVQDLACMLRRRKIPFDIVAGHVTQSNVLQRAAGYAKAAYAARCFINSRVLRVGNSFAGMGDFAVHENILEEQFGIDVWEISPRELRSTIQSVTAEEIDEEVKADRGRFEIEASEEVHRRSVRIGLGLRRYLEGGNYSAFSQNFLDFDSSKPPVNTVPFLEASKCMSRGVGYAGEGDVLTASLVGAMCKGFGAVTFTEAFCPDWKNGALFLSHMGEINPGVAADRPLLCEKDFPWTEALNPAILACAPASGPAVLVNLAPGPDDTFRLIVAPVDVLEDTKNPELRRSVRGWIRPRCKLESFLEDYSRSGGTHHCALALGDRAEAIGAFASYIGVERIVLHE